MKLTDKQIKCKHDCGRTCHGIGKNHFDTCNKCGITIKQNSPLTNSQ